MGPKQDHTQVKEKAKQPFQRPASTVGGGRDGAHRQRIEDDKIQNPEKYATLIQNDGTAGRTNRESLGLDDDSGADHYTQKAEEQKITLEQIAFRENCEMICEVWDEQAEEAGIEDNWDNGFNDDFDVYDDDPWGDPDYEDTGFTCGITQEFAEEIYGGSLYFPTEDSPEAASEPDPLKYDVNPVSGEVRELTEDEKINAKIVHDSAQITEQTTSLTMVSDLAKQAAKEAPLITTDAKLADDFTSAAQPSAETSPEAAPEQKPVVSLVQQPAPSF